MAEEEEAINEEPQEAGKDAAQEIDNRQDNKQIIDEDEYHRPPCNPRLEELAKPTNRLFYNNYQLFRCTLPKERAEHIGQTLQEDMAISTEEAAECLKSMRQTRKARKKQKIALMKAKKEIKNLSKQKQIALMKRCVRETLKTAMYNAYFNPKQIIMSDRLRRLSNLIVKDICKIMNMPVPDRCDMGRRAKFLFAVGDYFAYGIETMYFEIQVKNIMTYEEIKERERQEELEKQEKVN